MRKPDYIPQPSRHRSGNAVLRLNGKDFYLGPYGSPEATLSPHQRLGHFDLPPNNEPNQKVVRLKLRRGG